MTPETKNRRRIIIIAVVAAALILTLWLKLINVNQLKPLLEEQVTAATGYEMSLDGVFRLKLLPLGIDMSEVHLRNPAGFQATDLMYVPKCRVGLKLRPLIGRRLVPADITLNGIQLQLERNSARQANWDFTDDAHKLKIGQMLLGCPFNNLNVENGRIVYRDVDGSEFVMENVALKAGSFAAPDSRVNFEFKAKAENIPFNRQGYTAETLSRILHGNWPYAVQLHFINKTMGMSQ